MSLKYACLSKRYLDVSKGTGYVYAKAIPFTSPSRRIPSSKTLQPERLMFDDLATTLAGTYKVRLLAGTGEAGGRGKNIISMQQTKRIPVFSGSSPLFLMRILTSGL